MLWHIVKFLDWTKCKCLLLSTAKILAKFYGKYRFPKLLLVPVRIDCSVSIVKRQCDFMVNPGKTNMCHERCRSSTVVSLDSLRVIM